MDPSEMHERSQAVFGEVLSAVTESDLGRSTPCADWTVANLIDHVVNGNVSSAEMMGRAPTELPDGDRDVVHRASAEQANEAFSEPGWHERFVELPFGSVPAPVFASIRSGDLYAHAWDLAVAIGADSDLDRELGEAIFAATAPVLSPSLRGDGRPFGDEQFCAPDRPVADRLAGFLGRKV